MSVFHDKNRGLRRCCCAGGAFENAGADELMRARTCVRESSKGDCAIEVLVSIDVACVARYNGSRVTHCGGWSKPRIF